MSFLMLASQKTLFNLKKSQLQFEWTVNMNRFNSYQQQAADYASSKGDDYEIENDATYIALEKYEHYYEITADAIKSQIDTLDQEINNMKTMVQNDLKSTCALNLIGGS